jgi:hypothetical protein
MAFHSRWQTFYFSMAFSTIKAFLTTTLCFVWVASSITLNFLEMPCWASSFLYRGCNALSATLTSSLFSKQHLIFIVVKCTSRASTSFYNVCIVSFLFFEVDWHDFVAMLQHAMPPFGNSLLTQKTKKQKIHSWLGYQKKGKKKSKIFLKLLSINNIYMKQILMKNFE